MISKNSLPENIAGKAPAHSVKAAISILIKAGVSAAIIFFLFTRIKPSQIWEVLKAYPVSSLPAPLILYLLFGFWASLKWNMLLPGIRFAPLLRVSFVRYFYALIGPGIVTGDVARAYLLCRRQKERFDAVSASVVVDRVTGFIGLALTGIAGILASSISMPSSLLLLCIAAVLICLAAVFSLRFATSYSLITSIVGVVVRKIQPLGRFNTSLQRCIDALHLYVGQSGLMLRCVAAGIVSQAILITAIACAANGLGLKVAYWDWCWIFCVVSITVLLPITISGLGIREGSFVALLSLAGVNAEKAIALSLLVFCLDVFLGAIGWLCHFRLSSEGRGAHCPNA